MRRLFIGLQDLSYVYTAIITCAMLCWENLELQGFWLLQTIQCEHNYVCIVLCWNNLVFIQNKKKNKIRVLRMKNEQRHGLFRINLWNSWLTRKITNFSTEFNSHSNLTRIRTFCSKKSSQKQPLYLGHSDSIQTSSPAIKTSNPLKRIFLYQRIFHFLDQHGNSSIVLSALKRVAVMTHGSTL